MTAPRPAYADHGGYGDRPWRVGRTVGRTVYDAHHRLIGVMDTPALAGLAVLGVNTLDAQEFTVDDADMVCGLLREGRTDPDCWTVPERRAVTRLHGLRYPSSIRHRAPAKADQDAPGGAR